MSESRTGAESCEGRAPARRRRLGPRPSRRPRTRGRASRPDASRLGECREEQSRLEQEASCLWILGDNRPSPISGDAAWWSADACAPKTRFGLNFPAFLSTSAAIGTVELTGFEMILTQALGQCCAMPCGTGSDDGGYGRRERVITTAWFYVVGPAEEGGRLGDLSCVR